MKQMAIKYGAGFFLALALLTPFLTVPAHAAASPSIAVELKANASEGTTTARITLHNVAQDASALQFDLISNNTSKQQSIIWNPALEAHYTYSQDHVVAGDKIQRTFYLVATALPIAQNGDLYVGEMVYLTTDVTLTTSGDLKWLSTTLQEELLRNIDLKVTSSLPDHSQSNAHDNNSSNNENRPNNESDTDNTDSSDSNTNESNNENKPNESKPNDSNSSNGGNNSGSQGPSTTVIQQPTVSQDSTGEAKEPAPVVTAPFNDLAAHWAGEAIEYVAAKGIMNGTGKGQFEPNVTMTRAMFVQTLYNAEKLWNTNIPASDDAAFNDVAAGSWYEEAVSWAVSQGIVNGVGNGQFQPKQDVSREQMAVMMNNYFTYKQLKLPTSNQPAMFSDQDKISSWAAGAIGAIQQAGIMNGRNGNAFEPKANAKRAEVAVVFERLAKGLLAQ